MPRKKSMCSRVKKEKPCKRLHGCKYAKGSKRQFCRTRKNKSRKNTSNK